MGSAEVNSESLIDQTRGTGLNIDNIVILPGSEKWEKKRAAKRQTGASDCT